MTTENTIRMARKHVSDNPMSESSARLCLADSVSCYDRGDMDGARNRAIKSLAYSVGVGHEDYRRTI